MAHVQKLEQLNIRASASQKAKISEAAKLKNMNVSQFVLSQTLEAAEQVLADQHIVRLSAEDYDYFVNQLEEPAKDIPQLRELFSKPSILEQ